MAAKFNNFMKDFDGKEVCIGAKDGTNFMYIGPWSNIGRDILEKSISNYRNRMEKSIPMTLKSMETKAKYSYEFKDIEIAGKPVSAEILLLQHCEEMGKLAKKYRKAKSYAKSFKDLKDRHVVDSYVRDSDGRMAIMISGSEIGPFWFREEVQQFQILELLKKGIRKNDISQILGYSVDEIKALLQNYEENKQKAKTRN